MLYDDSNLKTICHMEVSNMKPLILYYSYRGNTQRIAKRIHTTIGGDIARIDTVVPYTMIRSCSARPSGGTPAPPPCAPF